MFYLEDPHCGPTSPCPRAERAASATQARLALASLSTINPDCAAVIGIMLATDDANHVTADLRMGWPLGRSRRAMDTMRDALREADR